MSTTLSQQRSSFALQTLGESKIAKGDKREKFDKLTAGLPAMILQNGFGLAMAFLLAKGEDHHKEAFRMIAEWLNNQGILKSPSEDKVMIELSSLSQDKYLRAQNEALSFLEWLKQYANAKLFS